MVDTVISINKREVVVNVGYKSDGIVPAAEFRYNPELKVGDTGEVYVESQEDKNGQLVLSHKEARAARSWDRVTLWVVPVHQPQASSIVHRTWTGNSFHT